MDRLAIDDKTKAILYANGCSFTDKRREKADTFKQLQIELKDCLKKFRGEHFYLPLVE